MSLGLAGLAAAGVAIGVGNPRAASERAVVATKSSCSVSKNTIGHVRVIELRKLWKNGVQRHNKKGFDLRPKDRLRTAQQGQVDFCLVEGSTSCRAFPGTKLKVKPSDKFLVNVLIGKAQCSTSSGGIKNYLAGDSVLKVGDPVFSVTVTKRRTVVKVFLGAVDVRGDFGRATPVVLGTGHQTVVARGTSAAKPAPILLVPSERVELQNLAGQLPESGFARPSPEESKALTAIFRRRALVVALAPELYHDKDVRPFSKYFLLFLAKSWDVKMRLIVETAETVADLAARKVDLLVTTDPAGVTVQGRQLGLGDAAGVAAVPFVAYDTTLAHLATPADAGLVAALRRFLTTAVIQSHEYVSRYVREFHRHPPYARLGDIAFPAAAHATGTATVLHHSFVAVFHGNVSPRLKAVSSAAGTCQGPSQVTPRADAWRCVDTKKRTWDPCFSGVPQIVVCPSDPVTTKYPTHYVKVSLQKPLPSDPRAQAAPTDGMPRLIHTAAGAICEPRTGPSQEFGSQPLTYVCDPSPGGTKIGYLVGAPIRATTPWTILFAPPDWQNQAADTTGLDEVWFW